MMTIDFQALALAASNDVPAGGYVVEIVSAEDMPERQYLKCRYVIAEGEYQGFYDGMATERYDPCQFIVSYKPAAAQYFLKFIRAIEQSNPGFAFTGEEADLVGKLVGVVLRPEEYMSSKGELEVKMGAAKFCTPDDIRNGYFPVLDMKKLKQ